MKKLLCFFSLFCPVAMFSQNPDAVARERLAMEYGAKTSQNNDAGVTFFIRFSEEKKMALAGNSLPEKAAGFFETYGDVFGMTDMAAQFFLKKTSVDAAGGTHLMYGQRFQGIPVFGGDFRLHFNARGELTSVNGVAVPGISTSVLPNISAEQAAGIALRQAAATHPGASATWFVRRDSLYIFRKGLVQGFPGSNYLVYEMEVANREQLREFIYVDAATGNIAEHFPGTCEALFRRLYTGSTNNQIWQEGDPFPGSLTTWQQSELNGTEGAYNFFKNVFGRNSYDNAGAEMKIVHAPTTGLTCPNAQWNGITTNFCDQVGTDDLVGHEWAHAYTEFTNNLIYAWQTGALNESYSDIWGETIDLLTPDGNDNVLRTSCANSQLRWQLGESAPAFSTPVRDMWDPTCDGLPGKVTDTQYSCSSGVHINSGVPNHAYALLTDGGTFNGHTVTGLGLTKAAHIFWQAQTAYLTNTSNFNVMADALEAACSDLIGVNLEGLSVSNTPAGPSGQIITAADCQEVSDAIAAVQLRTPANTTPEPGCTLAPLLGQSPPAPCGSGTIQTSIFFDNFESGLGNWTVTQIPVNPAQWTSRQWIIDTTPPGGRSGSVVAGPTPDYSNCYTGDENGIIRLESPVISIPGSVTAPVKMTFDHYFSMENGTDGGNLKYKLNSGAWTVLPSSAFTYNAYIYSALITAANGNDNPLAGQPGFSAADIGSVTSTWGQSQINLANIGVVPGSTIQFRFETGTNSCVGWDGWYLDDVNVFTCELALPVELLDFRATPADRAVLLEWATGPESNNAGFELQRKAHAATGFEKIAFLKSKGATQGGSPYRFTDTGVQPGQTYYYRLRQMDEDGSESYSPVVSATLPEEARLFLQPNPAGDFLDIKMTGNESPEMEILLTNMQGKVLLATKTKGEWRVDLANFATGIYLVKVVAGPRLFLQKFIKN